MWANFIQYGRPTNICIVYVDQGVQQWNHYGYWLTCILLHLLVQNVVKYIIIMINHLLQKWNTAQLSCLIYKDGTRLQWTCSYWSGPLVQYCSIHIWFCSQFVQLHWYTVLYIAVIITVATSTVPHIHCKKFGVLFDTVEC